MALAIRLTVGGEFGGDSSGYRISYAAAAGVLVALAVGSVMALAADAA